MLSAWTEWKRRCARALCSAPTQQCLGAFGKSRFWKILRRYNGNSGSLPKDPWHLFETHVHVRATRRGKRYKDWLFARTELSDDPALDVIQGGASLIMRDVVREHLRHEGSMPNTQSLDDPLTLANSNPVSLLDVLASDIDPIAAVCLREYGVLARRHAATFLPDVTPREHTVLMARHMNLSLIHPAVLRVARCRKTLLNDTHRALLTRIARALKRMYENEVADSVITLTLMTVREMARPSVRHNQNNRQFAPLFWAKGNDDGTATIEPPTRFASTDDKTGAMARGVGTRSSTCV